MSDTEICQRCGEDGYDRRTLWMACFYEMSELGLPFEECAIKGRFVKLIGKEDAGIGFGIKTPKYAKENLKQEPDLHGFYTLRVCKECRGAWLGAQKEWFNSIKKHSETGTGVFVRRNGANVELTPEEVEDWRNRNYQGEA